MYIYFCFMKQKKIEPARQGSKHPNSMCCAYRCIMFSLVALHTVSFQFQQFMKYYIKQCVQKLSLYQYLTLTEVENQM